MPRALLSLLLVLSLPATASAAVGWTDPFSIDEGIKERPVVSTLGSQQVTLVSDWAEMRIDFSRGAFGQEPGVRSYPAENGVPLGIALGTDSGSVSMTAVYAAVTVEDGYQFYAVTNADLEQVVQLSDTPGEKYPATFAANDAGDAAIAWFESENGFDHVKMVRIDRDGSVSDVVDVGTANDFVLGTRVPVAVSPAGNVLVAYPNFDEDQLPADKATVRFAEYDSDLTPIAVPTIAQAYDVAVTYAGSDMYALLETDKTIVRGRTPGQPWDGAVEVSQSNSVSDLGAAGNASGDAVFTWMEDVSDTDAIMAAHRDSGDSGHAVASDGQVSAGDAEAPRVDINSLGEAVIAYGAGTGPYVPSAVRRARDGDWTSEEPIGGATEDTPYLDVDSTSAVLTWRDGETAWLAGLDRTGPFFVDTPFAPRTAALGAPINLCATADDDWGPIAYSWVFSDGTTDSGPCVDHPLTQAGAQAAVVTVSDQLGNTASGTFPLTITPPGPTGPGLGKDAPPAAAIGKLTRRRISGTAVDDKGVASVQVGLARRGNRCRQLTSVKRRRFRRVRSKPCAPKKLFAAKGTTAWSLKLGKRLRKGRYVVLVRVTDTAGTTAGAKRTFRLR